MAKPRSLLDNVPTIEERLQAELDESKATLRSVAKRNLILSAFITLSTVGYAIRAGAWNTRHSASLLIAIVFALFSYRRLKQIGERDV